jgi:hypothetical protein
MMMTSITGRARRYFERVETEETYAQVERQLPTNIIDDDDEDEDDNNDGNNEEEDGIVLVDVNAIPSSSPNETTTTTTEIPLATAIGDDDDDEEQPEVEEQIIEQQIDEQTLSLNELESARDEALQQSSSCIMLGSYILMMLWLQAFTTGDMGLFLISLVLSTWFVQYVERAQQNVDILNQLVIDFNNSNGTSTTGRRTSGVNEIVKQHWDKFIFNSRASLIKKENFGSTTSRSLFTIDDDDDDYNNNKLKNKIDDDSDTPSSSLQQNEHQHHHHEDTTTTTTTTTDNNTHPHPHPECSICLCEYEKGDKLVSLNPCHHVFHEECIASWTNHNTRCPLCNVDLVTSSIHINTVNVDGDDIV